MKLSYALLGLSEGLTRITTGVVLSQSQISKITKDLINNSLAMWLAAPAPSVRGEDRVAAARTHIDEASRMIAELKLDLEQQAAQLDAVGKEIEEKRTVAQHYAKLAETNQGAFAEFRLELENTLRTELETQAKKGRRVRRLVSIVIWIITLFLGAALGAYIQIRMEPYVKPPAVAPETPKQTELSRDSNWR